MNRVIFPSPWRLWPPSKALFLRSIPGAWAIFEIILRHAQTCPRPIFSLYSPRDKSSEAYDCQSAAVTFCAVSFGRVRVKANSHRHAGHDKSVSRPLRRCELDSRQLKTVADRKSEVWIRLQQSSNSHRHTRHDKTVSPAGRPPPRRRPGRQLRLAARSRRCTPRKM